MQITLERETFKPESQEIKNWRKKLHYRTRETIQSFGWASRDKIVREVKNIFLWKNYKVETSRALSLEQIREATHRIKRMNKDVLVQHLVARDVVDNENDLLLLSSKQRNKIVRIMVYVIKLSPAAQLTYIEETVSVKEPIGLLTVNEANEVIKRVEKWEANILLKK